MHGDGKLAWLALAWVALTLGLQLWPGAAALLRFSRAAYESGAWWQLLTSQGVHLSGPHAVANAVALLLIATAGARFVGARDQFIGLAGGYIGVALVLAFDPDCAYYAGASGALHGLLAGNAVHMLRGAGKTSEPADAPVTTGRAAAVARGLGLAMLAGLALKLWLQDGATAPAGQSWLGVPVYQPAHAAGMAGGVILVLLVLAARVFSTPSEQQSG